MKYFLYLLLAVIYAQVISSCDRRSYASAYGSGSGSGSGNAAPVGNSGRLISSDLGYYNGNTVPTKRMIPYEYIGGGQNQFDNFGSRQKERNLENKGILTASELNDLSNWRLWKDIDSNQLADYRKIWGMDLDRRFTVVAMNEKKCPITGLKVKLLHEEKVIWEAQTDNHGLAQLWSDLPQEIELKIECYVETKLVKTIDRAVSFFNGLNTVVLNQEPLVNDEVDIVFAVDATSSMGDEIDFLKDDLMSIITNVKTQFPNDNLQLGSVFYQCEGSGNDYVTVESDLSSNIEKTLSFIEKKGATGGGEEVVHLALDKAINSLSWRKTARSKLLFIVLDEPPTQTPEIAAKMAKAYQEASAKGIRIIPCVTSNGGYSSNRLLEFLMRNAAIATNGTFLFLTDDSGVGGQHTVPFTDNYTVELFKDVLTRVIKQYCEKGTCTGGLMDEVVSNQVEDNKKELVSNLMDSITSIRNDSIIATALLPFTSFTSREELIRNKPLSQIDTAAFLTHFEEVVVEMVVYPNPTLGEISVKANQPLDYFELLDESGKLLTRLKVPSDQREFKIDLSNFPSGVYFIRCTIGETILQSSIRKV